MAKQGKSTKKVKNAVVDTQQTVVDNHQEQQGITNEEWKERLLTVNGNVVKLKHKSLTGKNPGTQEYSFEPEELPLEKNLKLKPEKIGGEIKAEGEVFSYTNNVNIQDEKEQTIRYLSMGGTVDVEIPGLEKQTINLQSTCIVMPPGENGEIFLLFRDPLVSELKDDKKFKLELNRGRYVKFPGADNGTMYFQGSNVYYKDNLIAENVWLECDQNGLHMNEEGELSLNQDKLDEEAWNGFDQKGEIVLEFAKTGPYVGMVTWEEGEELVTYETLDGIAEIIDVDYDSDSNTGTGDLLLHDFLVKYSNINVKLPVHSDDKKLEGVKVTYSGKEDDLINVEPKKGNKLELELLSEGEFQGVTGKMPLILDGIGIKDSNFVVGEVRIDAWLEGQVENEKEKLKKLFDCNIGGSVAYRSNSVKASKVEEDGVLEIEQGGISLGRLSVENFLGALSGEGDYLEGYFTVKGEKEKEADLEGAFNFGEVTLSDGFNVKLPKPLDFLDLDFKLTPSAKIGGELGGTVNRNESFGNPWNSDSTLQFEDGHFRVLGNAGLEGSIGLTASAFLASVALSLVGNLSATLDTKLTAQTAFGMKDDKVQQAEDLTFTGAVNASVGAGVTFGGNVKFLFWNKQILELEKTKNDMVTVGIQFAGRKVKDAEGITKGWKIDNGTAFFKALTKEAIKQIKVKPSEMQIEKDVDAILELVGKEGEDTWTTLVALSKCNEDVAFYIKLDEKEKMLADIDNMQKKVKEKLEEYEKLAKAEIKRLRKVIEETNASIALEENFINETREKADVLDDFREKAIMGGYMDENYKDASPEMKSIDFIIYNLLGEISEENLTQLTSTERANEAKWKRMSNEVKEEIYHEKTYFGDKELLQREKEQEDLPMGYTYNFSYYRMLHKKVSDLKTDQDLKLVAKNQRKLHKKNTKIASLKDANNNEITEWIAASKKIDDKAAKKPQKWTGRKVADEKASNEIALNKALKKNINRSEQLQKENEILKDEISNGWLASFPLVYRKIIGDDPNMTIEQLLRIAVDGFYKDQKIEATAMDKEELLEACCYSRFESYGLFGPNGAKQATDASWRRHIDSVLKERLKNKEQMAKDKGIKLTMSQKKLTHENITLPTLIQETPVEKAFELIAASSDRVEAAKKRIESVPAEINRLEERIKSLTEKKNDNVKMLNDLGELAKKAIESVGDNIGRSAAQKAITLLGTQDYAGIVSMHKETEELIKKATGNLVSIRSVTDAVRVSDGK